MNEPSNLPGEVLREAALGPAGCLTWLGAGVIVLIVRWLLGA